MSLLWKRTVGKLDMGGGLAQIAFEVPHSIDDNFAGSQVGFG